MADLKEKLGPVGKHGFWIATGVLALVSIGCWWVATSSLESQTNTWAKAIESKNAAMTSLEKDAGQHPNPNSHEQMKKRIMSLQEDVLKTWEKQYERQRPIFVWPATVLEPAAREVFVNLTKNAIEVAVPFPTEGKDEVARFHRENYAAYIKDQLQPLADIISAKWTAEFSSASSGNAFGGIGGSDAGEGYGSGYGGYGGGLGGASGYGGGAASPSGEPPPLVDWTTESQNQLLGQMFPWRTSGTPTTLQVLYSQESLWILESVLKIIKTVNGDARFQPPIKKIERLSLGMMKASAGAYDGGGYGDGYGTESYGGSSTATVADPADDRYVDLTYSPLKGEKVRAVAMSETGNPEDAALVVAKRMPVLLRFQMDPRKVVDLLAACANAELTLEVRQVRWAAPDDGGSGMSIATPSAGGAAAAGSASDGYGESAGSGYGAGYGASYGGSEAGGGGPAGTGELGGMGGYGGGGFTAPPEVKNDISVDIAGVIYIYNKPDMKKLGIEKVDQTTVVNTEEIPTEVPPAPPPTEAPASGGAAPKK